MVESKPLSNIVEVAEVPSTPVEITFECKQVTKAENSASGFGKISQLNNNSSDLNENKDVLAPIATGETEKDTLAPIANGETVKSDSNANLPVAKPVSGSKNNLFSNEAPTDWKREKTYDGSPIYRVMTIAPFD